MSKRFNANLLSHARRLANTAADEKRERILKVMYLIAFIYALIIDLAYILGSALMLAAGEEGAATAASELWLTVPLVLALAAAAVSFLKKHDTAGLILTCISCVLQFFAFLGLTKDTAAFLTRHALPLSLLLIFAILLFIVRHRINARITTEYDRIESVLYSAAAADGETPSVGELERIFDSFDGELPESENEHPLKRSQKSRQKKENKK